MDIFNDGREAERRDDRRREQRAREKREQEHRAYEHRRHEEEARHRHHTATDGSLFGDIKRAVGIDTNKFVITAKYKCFADGRSETKNVTIKQEADFKAMMAQEFFMDLVQHGPLLIEKLTFTSEHPLKTYHVHKKLLESLDRIISVFDLHDLSLSVVERLIVVLNFNEEGEDEVMFSAALDKVAKIFNIKYASLKNDTNKSIDIKAMATPIDLRALKNIISEDMTGLITANRREAQFRAVFISQSSNDAFFAEGSQESAPVIIYLAYAEKQPGHFVSGTLTHKSSHGRYIAMAGSDEIEITTDMIITRGDGDFVDMGRSLIPAYKNDAFSQGPSGYYPEEKHHPHHYTSHPEHHAHPHTTHTHTTHGTRHHDGSTACPTDYDAFMAERMAEEHQFLSGGRTEGDTRGHYPHHDAHSAPQYEDIAPAYYTDPRVRADYNATYENRYNPQTGRTELVVRESAKIAETPEQKRNLAEEAAYTLFNNTNPCYIL